MKSIYSSKDETSKSVKKVIAIPEPCHENWNSMTPREQGRHCASCDKVVVDFRNSTKEEIIDQIEAANGKTCGRFKMNQVQNKASLTSKLTKIAASIMAIVAANEVTYAQDIELMGDVIVEPMEISVANAISKSIRGCITDESNNIISNAKISVFSGDRLIKSAMSDEKGHYSIDLPPGTVTRDIVSIRVHASNFTTKSLDHLTLKKASTTLNISLTSTTAVPDRTQFEIMGGARIIDEPIIEVKKEIRTEKAIIKKENKIEQQIKACKEEYINPTEEKLNYKEGQIHSDLTFEVYPNPTKDVVKLRISEMGEYHYFVTDIIGNIIFEGFFVGSQIEFSFRNQQAGIYLFNLREKGVITKTAKIVVKK